MHQHIADARHLTPGNLLVHLKRLFALSKPELDDKVFLLLGIDKIGILLFFLIPSIALRLVSSPPPAWSGHADHDGQSPWRIARLPALLTLLVPVLDGLLASSPVAAPADVPQARPGLKGELSGNRDDSMLRISAFSSAHLSSSGWP
ncbi:hypothetical protein KBY96_11495 [Cyanobium sp. ATX 6A2]|uniref:hypothetical protein n=1 Tax=Cyanobium sp. ATX 6A2 TaxID=2823700 RepID=UPI0020CC69E8|nr:hypothetical protein [Cyanobium sp. ATX 6A2]MCP9888548.1 hypothetical protein [Cyanobium sp. ATX 6A2]